MVFREILRPHGFASPSRGTSSVTTTDLTGDDRCRTSDEPEDDAPRGDPYGDYRTQPRAIKTTKAFTGANDDGRGEGQDLSNCPLSAVIASATCPAATFALVEDRRQPARHQRRRVATTVTIATQHWPEGILRIRQRSRNLATAPDGDLPQPMPGRV